MAECTSPLTRQAVRLRGFESLTLRTVAADCRPRIGLESDREPIYKEEHVFYNKVREHEAMERAEEPIYSAMTSVYRS